MKLLRAFSLVCCGLVCAVATSAPATAAVVMGTGNSSLLGGDLSDPDDTVVDTEDYGAGKPEDEMRPPKATWVKMRSMPNSPPGSIPHQMHAYQSWQNTPACAIFLNKPENRKWYISFIDGGNGGPTEDDPFSCAIQLKQPYVLTHFTITTAAEMPDRDPRQWAVQGSNTGEDDDWTEIYRCDAADRNASPFQVNGRLQTMLFTSFTTASMAKDVSPADLKKLEARLKDQKIEKADFVNTKQAFSWYRIVVFSCFNPNSTTFRDFNRPPGFSLGQMELFGVPGVAVPAVAKARTPRTRIPADKLIKPEAYDPAFIISYWCGPTKEETTLERYKEIADCGFNVAQGFLWEPASPELVKLNMKYLDLCQQVGIKGLVWDGISLQAGGFDKRPTPEEIPRIEKTLDGMIAQYSAHPAFMGFILGDEGNNLEGNHRLGVINEYLARKDPKHLPYYNLLPAYAFNPLSTYDEFVARYIEDAKPALVSYDHYRQMFESGDERTYWYNMELMRKKCAAARLPFNQIIVSNRHMGYRECSEVDLRWQVYTSLAYGSRGIQYFTYWFTPGLAWADAPALISKDGKRDVKWEYVRKINRRIAKLGPTLARLTSTGAYCTAPIPPGARKLAAGAPVRKAEGGALAIGCFQDPEGKQYVMVVNRSFGSPVTAMLTFDDRVTSAAEISQDSGEILEYVAASKGPLGVKLEPGEGRLFILSESGIFHSPPAEVFGGRDLELAAIEFEPTKPENKGSGAIFWRAQGAASFETMPLAALDATHFKVTLPAAATKAPFEYYLEMQESGEKPVREPERGSDGPLQVTPDQTPPTAVSVLRSTFARSYRVVLGWEPASDDRGVAGYRLFRGAADNFPIADAVALAKISAQQLQFADEEPPLKQTVWYAVQPVDVVGREGPATYVRVDVPDHQPPDNTLSLQAVPGSKCVMLTWSGAMEPIVTALEIHRGAGADGAFEKVAEVTDLASTRYLDKGVEHGTKYRYSIRPRSKANLLGEPGQIASAAPLKYLKRINCGGPAVAAADGVDWEADNNPKSENLRVSGTSTYTAKSPVNSTGEVKEVCRTERWANRQVSYGFPVDPGRYEVALIFAETNPNFAAKGKRPFDISINEEKVKEKVDIFSEAGGAMTPWILKHQIDVSGGELLIRLDANRAGPAIKAIEIRSVGD
jgi:hypothetical protein